jgi:hypothetical protein
MSALDFLEFLEVMFGVFGVYLGIVAVAYVLFNVLLPLPFLSLSMLPYALWFLVAINLGLFLYEEVRDVIYI